MYKNIFIQKRVYYSSELLLVFLDLFFIAINLVKATISHRWIFMGI